MIVGTPSPENSIDKKKRQVQDMLKSSSRQAGMSRTRMN